MTDLPSKHVKIQKVAPVLKISAVLLLSRPFSNSFAFNCFNNYSSAGSSEALSLLKESVTTSYSFTRKSVLNSPCLLNNLLNTNVTRICMAKYCTSFSIKTGSVKLLKFSPDVPDKHPLLINNSGTQTRVRLQRPFPRKGGNWKTVMAL